MIKTKFGTMQDGSEISIYTFENKHGLKMVVSDLGAHLINLWVPDKNQQLQDVVLGFPSVEDYKKNTNTYFGAIVGRNANRTAGAQFEIDGKMYHMPKNEGENNLHSGPNGYQIRLWEVKNFDEEKNSISFLLNSPDEDQGFPGDLLLEATYTLTENDELVIAYNGSSNQKTVFNPTNHSYFNLNGHTSGDVLGHTLQMNAPAYTPVIDEHSIPTGEIASVENTPMDFRSPKTVGQEINVDFDQLNFAGGYDHNFAFDEKRDKNAAAVTMTGDKSGITMEVYTDLPGVQVYTANGVNDVAGKEGFIYQKRSGICMETQFFPNAMNEAKFTSPILEKDQPIRTETTFKFTK